MKDNLKQAGLIPQPKTEEERKLFSALAEVFKEYERSRKSEAIKRGLEKKKEDSQPEKNEKNLISNVQVRLVKNSTGEGLLGFASCLYRDAIYLDFIQIHYEFNLGVYLIFPRKDTIDSSYPVFDVFDPKTYKQLKTAVGDQYVKEMIKAKNKQD